MGMALYICGNVPDERWSNLSAGPSLSTTRSGVFAPWPFIQFSAVGRIVTLSLDHPYATVYDQRRIPASDPAELVKAIRGRRRKHIRGPDQPNPKASMVFQPESGPDGGEGRSGQTWRVWRTRNEEATKAQDMPRASRARKGG